MSSHIRTVISGSYRKHLAEMLEVKAFLSSEGVEVVAPVSAEVVNPGEEFILLDEDCVADPRTLQDSIFAKMRGSSFLVLANVDDYNGKAAVLEMGYAIALGIQILTLEPVSDPNLAGYCRPLAAVFQKWERFARKERAVCKTAHA
jgi:nucleoside 2-deoxyribosyltransferase